MARRRDRKSASITQCRRSRSLRRVRPQLGGESSLESRLLLSADATGLSLSASAASIRSTTNLTLTATVTDVTAPGTTPTGGSVTFLDGTTTLGTGSLNNGTASFSTSSLNTGIHHLTAVYGGAGPFLGSKTGITPTSTITTIGGNGTYGDTGDGGQATNARIGFPIGVVGDAAGNLYVADYDDSVVRKIAVDGTISTYAGTDVSSGSTGDGGQATSAQIGYPYGLAVDSQGDLFIADENNNVVREVTTDGIIHTVAGNTESNGYSGDGGPATAAALNYCTGVAVDSQGNLFIADQGNNVIREVTTDGIIHTVVGNGTGAFTGDGGQAIAATLDHPFSVTFDAAGNLFIDDQYNNAIREVTTDGIIHTVAGTGTSGYTGDGGAATAAKLSGPEGVAVDAAGNLYIDDYGNNVIREVTTDGKIQTLVGTGTGGFSGDGGPANQAQLLNPYGLTIEPAGNLIINDSGNNRVRELVGGIAVAVTQDTTRTELNSSAASIDRGGSLTLTATVADVTSPSFTPTGTVTFLDGTTVLGTASLVSGTATFTTTTLSPGKYALKASYAGQGAFVAGTSVLTSSSPITTFAGDGTGSSGNSGNGGQATAAKFNEPEGVAFDPAGNLYIADYDNHVVRKVTPAGIVSIFAGTGESGDTGDGGQATAATLDYPSSLALDAAGNLYISDGSADVVRKVTPAGIISTFAGNGTAGYMGNGGQATSAELDSNVGIAFDAAGNLYIADSGSFVVRKVTPGGVISTIAGNSNGGYTGDGGQATAAELIEPDGVAVDAAGNLYISDGQANVVRKVTPAGIISTVVGNGTAGSIGDGGQATAAELDYPLGITFDAYGDLFIASENDNVVREVTPNGIIQTIAGIAATSNYGGDGGPASQAGLYYPEDVAFDAAGNLYIADTNNYAIREVMAVVPVTVVADNTKTTLAASVASITLGNQVTLTATVSDLSSQDTPTGGIVTFLDGTTVLGTAPLVNGTATLMTSALPVGQQYLTARYADTGKYLPSGVGITPTSDIITIAGNGTAGDTGDGGQATAAELNYPYGIAKDTAGNLYVSDNVNHVIRKITPAGIISTFAGNGIKGDTGDGGQAIAAELNDPEGLAFDAAGNLYVADYSGRLVREITPAGIISTVAGNGTSGSTGDGGQATAAEVYYPSSVAFDPAGNLYISEDSGSKIRKVTSGGIITTAVGTGVAGYSGDGGQATAAQINEPFGLTFDAVGDLYFADYANNVIREVTTDGIIHTIVGTGISGYSGDGGQATAATLSGPCDVTVDAAGDLFIADDANNVIREVTPDGIIITLAGTGSAGYGGDGGPATNAKLNDPENVKVDAVGDLIIIDNSNNVVREIMGSLPLLVTADQTSTSLTASTASSVHHQTITFTATIANLSASAAPTGIVTFMDGETTLGTASLVDGVATFTTDALTVGSHSISAVYSGDSPNYLASDPANTLETVAASGPAASFTLTGPTSETAGVASTVTVTAYDAYGNIATGYTGTVHFTSSDPGATLPADVSLADGVATFPFILVKAGLESITATDHETPAIQGIEAAITVVPAQAASFVISGPSVAVAGQAQTFTVTAFDVYGNLATGYAGTVHLTSSDPGATLPADVSLTSGVGTFQVRFLTAGTQSLTATDTVNALLSKTDAKIVVQQSVTRFVINGPTGSIAAGTTVTYTVMALDGNGNVVTGDLGQLSLASTDPHAQLPPQIVFVNGVATFQVQFQTAGNQSITATGLDLAALTATEGGILVVPGAATRFVLTGLTGAVGGTAETLTVTAYDAYGNLATGYAGTLHFSSTDPAATLPADATLTAGVGTFFVTLDSAGLQSVTATDIVTAITGAESGIATTAMIQGVVYHDLNADGKPQTGESGLAGRVLYLDQNHSGAFVLGDPTATTDALGHFSFPGVAAGSFNVLELLDQDTSDRYVVDQTSTATDGTLGIGVVPVSPIAPLPVVPNPFTGVTSANPDSAYVQSLYRVVLGREGGDDEVAGWLARMSQGATHLQVASAFNNSFEHRTDQVQAYYQQFLGRGTDPFAATWVQDLMAGYSEQQVVEGILNSPEYRSAHQGPALLIRDLYIEVLGRQGDSVGVPSFQALLASGASHEAIVADFVESAEANDQIVAGFYAAYLHRQPEPGSSNIWNQMLTKGASPTQVTIGILASDEFANDSRQAVRTQTGA